MEHYCSTRLTFTFSQYPGSSYTDFGIEGAVETGLECALCVSEKTGVWTLLPKLPRDLC